MFARLSTIIVAASVFAGALAAPSGTKYQVESEQCNGGQVQCCNSVQQANNLDYYTGALLGLLQIDVKQLTGSVGATCTALNVVGVGASAACNQQKVCCTGNSFNGVIALGCTPINVAL
ncbi:hydrophobin-315 [Coprinopsis marcescibilis]|uniref:Hydrophobin n=1 Tax=Coprinopsis marcescibilis TaxID=230819 RepID=A0A5C3KWJ7_COPMA|nr:hydrophobin-315 [Coprinopsis marcescibilis]